MRDINGLQVAVIGQAYPYTPITNPQHLVPESTFGIHEQPQEVVDGCVARERGPSSCFPTTAWTWI